MIGVFMPAIVAQRKLISTPLRQSAATTGSTQYIFPSGALGKDMTLICVVSRFTGDADSSATLGVVAGGRIAERLGGGSNISIDPATNLRGASSLWLAPSTGSAGTVEVSSIASTRCDIIAWGLENFDGVVGAPKSNSDGSATAVDFASVSMDTVPDSILFALATRTSGANAATLVGFSSDYAAVAFGTNATLWAGRNLAPANPQEVSITTVIANRHNVHSVVLR